MESSTAVSSIIGNMALGIAEREVTWPIHLSITSLEFDNHYLTITLVCSFEVHLYHPIHPPHQTLVPPDPPQDPHPPHPPHPHSVAQPGRGRIPLIQGICCARGSQAAGSGQLSRLAPEVLPRTLACRTWGANS